MATETRWATADTPWGITLRCTRSYLVGTTGTRRLCEIGIPATIDLKPDRIRSQECTDVTEGHLGNIDEGTLNLAGHRVYNDRLIVSAYIVLRRGRGPGCLTLVSQLDLPKAGMFWTYPGR